MSDDEQQQQEDEEEGFFDEGGGGITGYEEDNEDYFGDGDTLGHTVGIGEAKKKVRRSRNVISLEAKMEILRRADAGERLSHISRALDLPCSTVHTIAKSRSKIEHSLQTATPATACRLFHHRSGAMVRMEQLLSAWLEEQNRWGGGGGGGVKGGSMPRKLDIQRKALGLLKDLGGLAEGEKPFNASNGWFDRFKRRNCFNGAGTGVDEEKAQSLPREVRNMIESGGYTDSRQVFNVLETDLYWKRLPDKTFVSAEEKTASGFKAHKDRVTLLLGGNAAGDFKLTPALVYRSETPRALKNVDKTGLPVVWCWHEKAWMTSGMFRDWFTDHFCPEVEEYCEREGLPNRALLILDNAPCHPSNLNELSENVRVMFIPKCASVRLQPMDQGVTDYFKALYLRRLFKQIVLGSRLELEGGGAEKQDPDRRKEAVRNFWKNHTIMKGVSNVAESWKEVEGSAMNAAWTGLWPECVVVAAHDFRQERVDRVVADIARLCREVSGFEAVEAKDVQELLRAHGDELSNEYLVQMLLGQEEVLSQRNEEGTQNAAMALKNVTPRRMEKTTQATKRRKMAQQQPKVEGGGQQGTRTFPIKRPKTIPKNVPPRAKTAGKTFLLTKDADGSVLLQERIGKKGKKALQRQDPLVSHVKQEYDEDYDYSNGDDVPDLLSNGFTVVLDDSEGEDPSTSEERMFRGFSLIQQGLQILADNDPDPGRSICVISQVNKALRRYKEFTTKTKTKRKARTKSKIKQEESSSSSSVFVDIPPEKEKEVNPEVSSSSYADSVLVVEPDPISGGQ